MSTSPPPRATEAASGAVPTARTPRLLASRVRLALRSSEPLYVWLFCLGILANIFNGHSDRLGLPISPDRILLPLALLLMLRDPARPRLRFGLLQVLVALFVTWTVLSMIWYDLLSDSVAVYALLDRTTLPLVFLLVGPVIFCNQRRRDMLLKTLTLTGLYLGVTGVLEMVAPQLVWPRYIVDPSVGLHFGRARGPFAGAEGMGMALLLCAGAASLLIARRLLTWTSVAVVTVVLDVVGMGLAMTRSVWIAAAVALLVAVVLAPYLRRLLPVIVAAGVAVVLLLPSYFPALSETFANRASASNPVYDRLSSNMGALRVIEDLPLTGIGWRRFYPHGGEWARQSDTLPMGEAVIEVHNVLLSRAAELGIPAAFVLLLILLLGPLRATLRRAPRGEQHADLPGWKVLAGAMLAAWVTAGLFGPMANPFPNYLTFLFGGVADPERVVPAHAPDGPAAVSLQERAHDGV